MPIKRVPFFFGTTINTLIKNVNNIPYNLNTLKNSKINRYKQYFLADSGYDKIKNKKFRKS